jgi:hypothetical protein
MMADDMKCAAKRNTMPACEADLFRDTQVDQAQQNDARRHLSAGLIFLDSRLRGLDSSANNRLSRQAKLKENIIKIELFEFEEFNLAIFVLDYSFAEEIFPLILLSRPRTGANVFIQKHARVLKECHLPVYEQDRIFN